MDDWGSTPAACRAAPHGFCRHGSGVRLQPASRIKDIILIYFIFTATIKSLLLLFYGYDIVSAQIRTSPLSRTAA